MAVIGTTIAPWQFFYLQAGFVEKRVSARQYPQARLDVLIGSISCMVIVFFIIVCTGATLFVSGHHVINGAGAGLDGHRVGRGRTLRQSALQVLRVALAGRCRSLHVEGEFGGVAAGIGGRGRDPLSDQIAGV